MAETLGDGAIAARLTELSGWERSGDEIVRTVTAPSFPEAIAVVDEVAQPAEKADHHPDIDIRWRTLRFALTTHSAGGLTARDFDLAEQIDQITVRRNAT
ncbi:4a-hydroxytetrahydrobiopterin dehydratase [Actinomadura flavalba]|uniref:4a-hydroxytetrahydrobiopterin dehydratase n=1 Tax=Actinomadura flavalba TaxID=1120938 RepID=UPI0003611D76|nr:4a-hydroxytetrahydrobiopterin dehydratase [Actinomadura flavalba]